MLKIAFIGTHGVGKTTLCFDLAGILKKHLPSVDVVKEVARSCPLPINRETTLAAQCWILHTQIAMEIASAAQNYAVICDRSVLDNYAYLLAAAPAPPAVDELVTAWMATYDFLFKVPLGFELTQDGVRDTDRAFQQEIDERVDRLLDERHLRHHVLPRRSRGSWMGFIQKVIQLPSRAHAGDSRCDEPRQMDLPMTSSKDP